MAVETNKIMTKCKFEHGRPICTAWMCLAGVLFCGAGRGQLCFGVGHSRCELRRMTLFVHVRPVATQGTPEKNLSRGTRRHDSIDPLLFAACSFNDGTVAGTLCTFHFCEPIRAEPCQYFTLSPRLWLRPACI